MRNPDCLRWRMLLLTMLCYLFFYTGRHNFGWASRDMAFELNVSYERIGWISFAMLLGYAIGQLIHGHLSDRYSPRHLMTTGALLSVGANIAISFSSSYTVILVLWGLNGYFQSMGWPAGARIITNWWPAGRRGFAFGMYTMAAGASSVLTFLFSVILLNEGWRNLFRVPVLLLGVVSIIFYLFIRNSPYDASLADGLAAESRGKPGWKEGFQVVFRNLRFQVVCLALGFQNMARYGLILWVPLYFQSEWPGDHAPAIWFAVLLPAGMAVGALAFGLLTDKLCRGNREKPIAFGMAMCGVISGALYLLPLSSTGILGCLVFGAGFFAYGPQANFWPLSPDLLGHRFTGTGIGVMNMFAYTFAALGEPLIGALTDNTGDRSVVFAVVAVIALLSAATVLISTKIGQTKQA